MQCPNCGYSDNQNLKFCPQCGAPVGTSNEEMTTPIFNSAPQNPPAPQPAQPGYGYNQGPQPGYGAGPQPGYGPGPQPGYGPGPQPGYGPGPQPGYGPGPQGGFPIIKKRNIAVCIILSIVTCGIYSLVWFIMMVNELNSASDHPSDSSGVIVWLLSIITCSIYMYVWWYKAGDKVVDMQRKATGVTVSNPGTTYLILSIFGLSIVNFCLLQSELNKIAVD